MTEKNALDCMPQGGQSVNIRILSGEAAKPSPGEKVPPVRKLGAGVEWRQNRFDTQNHHMVRIIVPKTPKKYTAS